MRKDLTGAVKSLLDIGSGILPIVHFKFVVPLFRRGGGIVGKAAEDLEEMPVTFELVVVIALLRREQIERLHLLRVSLHLRGQWFRYIKAALRPAHGKGPSEALYIVRVSPQEDARCSGCPEGVMQIVLARALQHIGIAVAPLKLVELLEVTGRERKTDLLRPILCVHPNLQAHVECMLGDVV